MMRELRWCFLDFESRGSSVGGSQIEEGRVIYQGVGAERIRNHFDHFVFRVTYLSNTRERSERGSSMSDRDSLES